MCVCVGQINVTKRKEKENVSFHMLRLSPSPLVVSFFCSIDEEHLCPSPNRITYRIQMINEYIKTSSSTLIKIERKVKHCQKSCRRSIGNILSKTQMTLATRRSISTRKKKETKSNEMFHLLFDNQQTCSNIFSRTHFKGFSSLDLD